MTRLEREKPTIVLPFLLLTRRIVPRSTIRYLRRMFVTGCHNYTLFMNPSYSYLTDKMLFSLSDNPKSSPLHSLQWTTKTRYMIVGDIGLNC